MTGCLLGIDASCLHVIVVVRTDCHYLENGTSFLIVIRPDCLPVISAVCLNMVNTVCLVVIGVSGLLVIFTGRLLLIDAQKKKE